ncbi:MAG: Fic family protein, partial [bacterium]
MKKWRKCKSFASILLCICLLFTMLPVSGRAGVYAAETEANEEVLTEVYTLIEEAAALMESLAMNHPFIDGNKRTAFYTTDAFL